MKGTKEIFANRGSDEVLGAQAMSVFVHSFLCFLPRNL